MGNETQNKNKVAVVSGGASAGKTFAIVMHSLEELQGMTVEQLVEYVTELFGERALIMAERADFEVKANDLAKQVELLTNQVTELEAFKADATSSIQDLSQELSSSKKIANEFEPTIKPDKTEYLILGKKFTWKNKEYTVAMLQADKKLQRELIDAEVGFLIEKSKKPAEAAV